MNKVVVVEGILFEIRKQQAMKKEADRKQTEGIDVVAYYKQEKEYRGYRKFNHR